MRNFFYKGRFIFIPFAIAAFIAITGFIVMNLWNYLMPVIFHLGVITFWQAVALFILCKLLFGFGKGGRGFGGRMRHERFKNMTPEEKEKFREKIERCGHGRWVHNTGWGDFKTEAEKPVE